MNNNNNGYNGLDSKTMLAAMIGLVAFLAYNAIVFIGFGFDHGGVFWISYLFTLIAFGSVCITAFVLKGQKPDLKDILVGYPIVKHSVIYLAIQLVLSLIFMALDYDCSMALAAIVQIVALAAHLILVMTCFFAKQTMDQVREEVIIDTKNMEVLYSLCTLVAQLSDDPEVKAAYTKLSEDVRYSDSVSNPATAEIERQLLFVVNRGKDFVAAQDKESALSCCDRAGKLLLERNMYCKLNKDSRC